MKLKAAVSDDRAVSPVIGVILMVAITVILAAVIGTFVLGLGSSVQKTTPQAQFGFTVEEDASAGSATCLDSGTGKKVEIIHETGETIKAGDLSVTNGVNTADLDGGCGFGSSSDVSAGTSWSVDAPQGNTIRVVWNSPEGQNSATLATFDVPN